MHPRPLRLLALVITSAGCMASAEDRRVTIATPPTVTDTSSGSSSSPPSDDGTDDTGTPDDTSKDPGTGTNTSDTGPDIEPCTFVYTLVIASQEGGTRAGSLEGWWSAGAQGEGWLEGEWLWTDGAGGLEGVWGSADGSWEGELTGTLSEADDGYLMSGHATSARGRARFLAPIGPDGGTQLTGDGWFSMSQLELLGSVSIDDEGGELAGDWWAHDSEAEGSYTGSWGIDSSKDPTRGWLDLLFDLDGATPGSGSWWETTAGSHAWEAELDDWGLLDGEIEQVDNSFFMAGEGYPWVCTD